MDYDALVGKYLRLRQELAAPSAGGHRTGVLGDIMTIELQLARAEVRQFADTQPSAVINTSTRQQLGSA